MMLYGDIAEILLMKLLSYNDLTIKQSLRSYNVENVNLSALGVDVIEDMEQEIVFARNFNLTTKTRLTTG